MKKIASFLTALLLLSLLTACTSKKAIEENSSLPATPQTAETPKSIVSPDSILDDQLFAQATNSDNLEQCNDIKDKSKLADCKTTVQSNLYTKEAISAKSLQICEKITLDRFKENCIKQVKADQESAKAIENNLKISQKAVDDNNYKVCDQLKDENNKYSCRYNVLTNKAISEKNPALCDQIGEKTFVDMCRQNLVN